MQMFVLVGCRIRTLVVFRRNLTFRFSFMLTGTRSISIIVAMVLILLNRNRAWMSTRTQHILCWRKVRAVIRRRIIGTSIIQLLGTLDGRYLQG